MVKKYSKDLSGKYNKKPVDDAKQSATDALKTTSKAAIQEAAKKDGYLIDIKTTIRLQKIKRRIIQRLIHKQKKNQ